MKKVISLVLVVALFAALAVCASADVVPHAEEPLTCAEWNWLWANGWMFGIPSTSVAVQWNDNIDDVKIVDITEGVKQTLTTCKQAITADELKAVCEADERIENLTVFRQRNVEEAAGVVDISVKLWPCAPDRKPNQATVVLFRAEGTEEWTVVGYAADKVCDAQLSGNGAYVVALAW